MYVCMYASLLIFITSLSDSANSASSAALVWDCYRDAELTRHFTLFVVVVVALFVCNSELTRNTVHLYLLWLFRCQQTFLRKRTSTTNLRDEGNAALKHAAGRPPGEQKRYIDSGELQPSYEEITNCSGHLPGNHGKIGFWKQWRQNKLKLLTPTDISRNRMIWKHPVTSRIAIVTTFTTCSNH